MIDPIRSTTINIYPLYVLDFYLLIYSNSSRSYSHSHACMCVCLCDVCVVRHDGCQKERKTIQFSVDSLLLKMTCVNHNAKIQLQTMGCVCFCDIRSRTLVVSIQSSITKFTTRQQKYTQNAHKTQKRHAAHANTVYLIITVIFANSI